jgi:phosphopantothenoylcysteine decarboxylase/phosphopantothenate--cysteine ligase
VFHPSYFAGSRIHLGLTGSVAAYKLLDFCRDLLGADIWISASLTQAGSRFVTADSLRALGVTPVYQSLFQEPDQPFPHLEPGHEADALLVAPATANFLAKMANGLADDLLSSQVLAFPGPVTVAPAMNPAMWEAAATQANVATLRRRGVNVVEPASGDVACGDAGRGKLPPTGEIGYQVLRGLAPRDLQGRKVLVTLGPTREHLDPVRYWSNPSTGKMGAAVASAAWVRGAEVHCVCGPCTPDLPAGISMTRVQTAHQMHDACLEIWPEMDIGCLCAAVCDFRPSRFLGEKLKKKDVPAGDMDIAFSPNPDILRALGGMKTPSQRLVGFAAETCQDMETEARAKLRSKHLDGIVANWVGCENSGFGSDVNSVLLVGATGVVDSLENWTKADIAWHLWDWILSS